MNTPPPSPPHRATGRLLADIGGTSVRFAWQASSCAPLQDPATLPTQGHPTLAAAARAYLQRMPGHQPAEAAFAIAAPVTGDAVGMINHPWAFSVAALRADLGVARLRVLNDFTALALGLPDLPPTTRRTVGGGAARPGKALALLGPGTGLGVSGLLPTGSGGWVPIEGEGGHVTLPASTPREAAVLAVLGQHFGHVSAERVLSGPGLVDLHAALRHADGLPPDASAPSAADLSQRALHADDARALETLELFCGWLGTVAGNLALTLGALGGVYIGGGIVPRWGDWFARSPFRARFEARGRYAEYLAAVPVWVIDADLSPALAGAARALDARAWGVEVQGE